MTIYQQFHLISLSIGRQLRQDCGWAGLEHNVALSISEPPLSLYSLLNLFVESLNVSSSQKHHINHVFNLSPSTQRVCSSRLSKILAELLLFTVLRFFLYQQIMKVLRKLQTFSSHNRIFLAYKCVVWV